MTEEEFTTKKIKEEENLKKLSEKEKELEDA